MATRKKPVSKTAPKVEKKVEFSADRRLTISVGVSAEYGQIKNNLTLSENIPNDADYLEVADSLFDPLSDKLIEQFESLSEKFDVEEEESEEEEEFEEEEQEGEEEEGEEEEDDEDEEEEDLTEDDIKKMKKPELMKLIKDEEIDIDTKGMKIADIKNAIIEELFEEEEGEEEEEDDSSEWDDDEWLDDDDE